MLSCGRKPYKPVSIPRRFIWCAVASYLIDWIKSIIGFSGWMDGSNQVWFLGIIFISDTLHHLYFNGSARWKCEHERDPTHSRSGLRNPFLQNVDIPKIPIKVIIECDLDRFFFRFFSAPMCYSQYWLPSTILRHSHRLRINGDTITQYE